MFAVQRATASPGIPLCGHAPIRLSDYVGFDFSKSHFGGALGSPTRNYSQLATLQRNQGACVSVDSCHGGSLHIPPSLIFNFYIKQIENVEDFLQPNPMLSKVSSIMIWLQSILERSSSSDAYTHPEQFLTMYSTHKYKLILSSADAYTR